MHPLKKKTYCIWQIERDQMHNLNDLDYLFVSITQFCLLLTRTKSTEHKIIAFFKPNIIGYYIFWRLC